MRRSALRSLASAAASVLRSPAAWEGGGVGGSRTAASTSAPLTSLSASRPASPRLLPKARLPAALHTGTVDVPEGVDVTLDGDTLTLAGPLGTSTTSLSRLDGRGDGAVRVGAGGRLIEVASVSKPFFGTLTSLLRSKIEVRGEDGAAGSHTGHVPPRSQRARTVRAGAGNSKRREKRSLNLSVPLFIHTQTPQGVTRGFLVYLRISGIGYRASLSGQTLTLKLGHSHDCTYTLPPSLRAVLPEPTRVGIYGVDKNQVTQAAANIVALRPPSVYKGKGVRLEGTEVRLKPGKRK
jgi:ribosomal protein L6P/L9E